MRVLMAAVLLFIAMGAHAGVVYYSVALDEKTARAIAEDEVRVSEALFESEGPSHLYLDKDWHALDWLLSKGAKADAENAKTPILGGSPIGVELSMGRAYLHDAKAVKRFAEALSRLSSEDIKKRYDPAAMDSDEVYPGEWASDPENLPALLHAFGILKAFYIEAAKKGLAVLYAWN